MSGMEQAGAPEDLAIVISRLIDAPPAVVFKAASQAEHLKRWFGPKGWPLTMCEVDFRVGGRFRFAMTGPSGEQNTPFGGEYLEIVPNERIVFDNTFEVPGADRLVMTYTFEERGGKTLFTIHTLFESKEARDKHIEYGFGIGTNSAIDNLEEIVAELNAEAAA